MDTSKESSDRGGGEALTSVFINYRKAESAGWARLLYDRLAAELGAGNVFLDQVALDPGTRWLQDIRSRSAGCTVLIALIGPRWASIMSERAKGSEEDYVRSEIEAALRKGSGVREAIPALVEDAPMPGERDLPYLGSVHPLLRRQKVDLRPAQWDADVAGLIERLRELGERAKPADGTAAEAEGPEADAAPQQSAGAPLPASSPAAPNAVVDPPEQGHFDEVAELMLEEGSAVVPFLGPGANSSDRTEPWRDADSGYLPDSAELASYLADKFDAPLSSTDLARVSQSVSVAQGPGPLYLALKKALPSQDPPGSVHRFLAAFPATTRELGLPERHQLIVTTNYDDALERAFDDAEEPYDVAVYLARGSDKGRFVHVPHDGEPRVIDEPNSYDDFPLDAFGGVERTVIMKVHGAVDRSGAYSWRDNYVITEDDYIDYMSVGEIGSIVPQQLLAKLRDYSHFLFLGHAMHDWNLRVFLIRIFGERGQPNTSWAIQREPSRLDARFWQRIGIDLAAIPLDEYVQSLGQGFARVAAAGKTGP